MTPEKVLEVVAKYEVLLVAYPIQQIVQYAEHPSKEEHLSHLRWMLVEMRQLIAGQRMEKAFRWLGYIQGILAAYRLRTIDQLREDSRPP
ncbi:MAG: hypothetical protein AAB515_03140 [Patescibacteria group bacterium]